MKRFKNDEIATQFVSDFGMTLELFIDTGNESIDESVDYPLLKFYADEESEEKFVEFWSGKELVQIPVSKLREALELVDKEVHSEAWFEKNVFKDNENT
ncbi:hypothetical protein HCH_03399 [Hahella chejuensis KCTC 2396]|uniref:Uncharacterized protein n=1 Tax=Hahella chejuensis (strain KCTC 2396) TaxID=349521 RepID=Q2SGS5_HAHCH|nr:hypothetical protein [Hahella chejuensis]ABC30149.1 hypothetical protein HCH_03399 [Hahella chejuensis KCTC 2396]